MKIIIFKSEAKTIAENFVICNRFVPDMSTDNNKAFFRNNKILGDTFLFEYEQKRQTISHRSSDTVHPLHTPEV